MQNHEWNIYTGRARMASPRMAARLINFVIWIWEHNQITTCRIYAAPIDQEITAHNGPLWSCGGDGHATTPVGVSPMHSSGVSDIGDRGAE
jgi:hypothetical protein